ncbi:MAG: hypothetical protein LWX01_11860 [Deltaproteobacteria bacterium]|nr:hypothetical protein [Deltaproteobacteria bacterium]MDL1962364.1 hypothetical protein [Deltaproteobacteria bacterium]MEA1991217.1 hypothetical protein [Thermodesulfobacteriota bacterium]
MLAYKKYVTIKNKDSLTLKSLPFKPGQRVKVVMIAEDDKDVYLADLQALLKQTQGLPEARSISEDEIAVEIAAYRAEQ